MNDAVGQNGGMENLDGRVAVVTGAGSGIGRAISLALAERGCAMALVDVNQAGLDETGVLINTHATTHIADVSDRARMSELPDEVVAAHGACNILVNNAGVTAAGRFEADDLDVLRWITYINVWGVVHGCHYFLPTLRKSDEAHIVNMSSMVAFVGLPQNAAYALSKGAVRSFTEALRGELAGSTIGVTAVFPGSIRTNIMHAARGAESERLSAMASSRLAPLILRPPSTVAKGVVRGIEHNRARVVVGLDARLLDITARLVPGRTGLMGRVLDKLT